MINQEVKEQNQQFKNQISKLQTLIVDTKASGVYLQSDSARFLIQSGRNVYYGKGYSGANTSGTVTFPKPYNNTSYVVMTTTTAAGYTPIICITNKTTTGFSWHKDSNNSGSADGHFDWLSFGW